MGVLGSSCTNMRSSLRSIPPVVFSLHCRQTNTHTYTAKNPTHAQTIVGVGNEHASLRSQCNPTECASFYQVHILRCSYALLETKTQSCTQQWIGWWWVHFIYLFGLLCIVVWEKLSGYHHITGEYVKRPVACLLH